MGCHVNALGVGVFNYGAEGWAEGLPRGGSTFLELLHQIGHGLGLAHPYDNGGGSAFLPGSDRSWEC